MNVASPFTPAFPKLVANMGNDHLQQRGEDEELDLAHHSKLGGPFCKMPVQLPSKE